MSEFHYIERENIWIGQANNHIYPYYLMPVFSLYNENKIKNIADFSVFINTIPKSGTYYLASAFKNIGWKESFYHLLGKNLVIDYRKSKHIGILDASAKNMYECPIELIANISRGQVIPCHIEYIDKINYFRKNKHLVVSLVRNLRNVLVSLYRFKKDALINKSINDNIWLKCSDNEIHKNFINYYRDKDLSHIILIADMILKDESAIILKYEELVNGGISKENQSKLDLFQKGLSSKLSEQLINLKGRKTMTLTTENRSDWKSHWTDDFDRFYYSSGMHELNMKLGYS